MFKPGDRVHVRTLLFSGWATVTDVFPGEMHPFQIILDNPDADGHAVKRVNERDITEVESK